MPRPSGAPATEYGLLYNTADLTIATAAAGADTWVTVAHASNVTSADKYTEASGSAGTVKMGKGDWKCTARVKMAPTTTATDDTSMRLLVTKADGTTSSPHPSKDITVSHGADGEELTIITVLEDMDNGATVAVQVKNVTDAEDLTVFEFELLVEGLVTRAMAGRKK